jgi:hypothetical protein
VALPKEGTRLAREREEQGPFFGGWVPGWRPPITSPMGLVLLPRKTEGGGGGRKGEDLGVGSLGWGEGGRLEGGDSRDG